MKTIFKNLIPLIVLCFVTTISTAHSNETTDCAADIGKEFIIPAFSRTQKVKHIRKISILHGGQVKNIQMDWTDENGNKYYAPKTRDTAGPGEKWTNIFLADGEYIVRITGRDAITISTVKFHTNKGNVYGPYGTCKSYGKPFDLKMPQGYGIIGFVVSFYTSANDKGLASFGVTNRKISSSHVPRPPVVKPWKTIFSFNKNASFANWETTTLGDRSGTFHRLIFGKNMKQKGSAKLVHNYLENRKQGTVLFTRPKWTKNGTIRGYFPKTSRLPANARLTGKFGFVQAGIPVKTTGAQFLIYVHYVENGQKKSELIFKHFKTYTGKLRDININLRKYTGKQVSFELRVDAGKSPTEDWAIWDNLVVQARN